MPEKKRSQSLKETDINNTFDDQNGFVIVLYSAGVFFITLVSQGNFLVEK